MAIEFTCTCGKSLHALDGSQGRRARCPRCGAVVTVPAAAAGAVGDLELKPVTVSGAPPAGTARTTAGGVRPEMRPGVQRSIPTGSGVSAAAPMLAGRGAGSRQSSLRRFTYVLLLLALIPLVLSTFLPRVENGDELVQAIADNPELVAQAEHGDISEGAFKAALFSALPNGRVHGALLAYDSHAHWLIAGAAAAGYFAFLLLVFPQASRFTKGLLFAGLFTGTAGVILLLVFQWAAFSMPMIMPRGVVGLVLLVVKLIGLSYSVADNPDNGFILSFLGYTCGVGLCEECTKSIPLLFRIKPTPGEEDPSWNSLLLWGLASGVGFGIAEGIMYSGRYYNGLEGAGMYYTRFVSCVALHAMWAGAVGVSIYRHQGDLLGAENNWAYFFQVVLIIIVPMTLHGLYDTLLKKEYDGMALVVAAATFAWLAYQIERQQRAEPVTA